MVDKVRKDGDNFKVWPSEPVKSHSNSIDKDLVSLVGTVDTCDTHDKAASDETNESDKLGGESPWKGDAET